MLYEFILFKFQLFSAFLFTNTTFGMFLPKFVPMLWIFWIYCFKWAHSYQTLASAPNFVHLCHYLADYFRLLVGIRSNNWNMFLYKWDHILVSNISPVKYQCLALEGQIFTSQHYFSYSATRFLFICYVVWEQGEKSGKTVSMGPRLLDTFKSR